MAYGLLVGVTVLIVLGYAAGMYHYAELQGTAAKLFAAYGDSVKLESFQLQLAHQQMPFDIAPEAKLDGILVYDSNGIIVLKDGGYYSAALMANVSLLAEPSPEHP